MPPSLPADSPPRPAGLLHLPSDGQVLQLDPELGRLIQRWKITVSDAHRAIAAYGDAFTGGLTGRTGFDQAVAAVMDGGGEDESRDALEALVRSRPTLFCDAVAATARADAVRTEVLARAKSGAFRNIVATALTKVETELERMILDLMGEGPDGTTVNQEVTVAQVRFRADKEWRPLVRLQYWCANPTTSPSYPIPELPSSVAELIRRVQRDGPPVAVPSTIPVGNSQGSE